MATDEQKKLRMMHMYNILITGLAHGLYDLFGNAMVGIVEPIGEEILEEMERELGIEIHGETMEDILTEVERIIVDEYGMVDNISLEIHPETHEVDLICTGCKLWHVTETLQAQGIPPHHCPPMMMASAALRKRSGRKARFVGITQDTKKKTCDIDFHLFDLD
jgi:SHS2 domain-containing protein